MNTQYRKNLKAVLEASKSYCDESIANLEWQIGTYNYDVATDSNVARIKTLPSDTYKSQIDYIGGKTVKYNQLVELANNTQSFTANIDTTKTIQTNISFNANDKLLVLWYQNNTLTSNTRNTMQYTTISDGVSTFQSTASNYNLTSGLKSWFIQPSGSFNLKYWGSMLSDDLTISNIEVINLTQNFGAGNEPTDVETAIPLLKANGYKLDGTDTYSTSKLKHAITTSVVYSGTDVQDITLPIPSEVLADIRYGLGFDNTNFNHLDSDGHLRGNWGIVDLGTLNYTLNVSNNRYIYQTLMSDLKVSTSGSTPINAICPLYRAVSASATWVDKDMSYTGLNNIISFVNNDYTTVEAFKTAMSGVYLVYELATAFDQDYSQYFTPNWNKVDLDNQYATCEMVVDEPIDMPNSITNLIKEVKA